jgi:hypothetical protein
MGVATGYTADHMSVIEAACIVSGAVVADHLILTRNDGTTIDAGNVRGSQGIQGVKGDTGAQGPGNATDTQVASFINLVGGQSQAAVDARVQLNRTTTDWNNEKTGGYVYGANTALNSPASAAFVGRVLTGPTSNQVVQEVWQLSSATTAPNSWYRSWNGSTWTAWYQMTGDTGWVALAMVPTTTTPGIAGFMEYRVVNRIMSIRSHSVTFTSQAQGSVIQLCPAGAIPAAYRPAITTYSHCVSGNAVGYLLAGTDGSMSCRASSLAMTSATSFMNYPLE